MTPLRVNQCILISNYVSLKQYLFYFSWYFQVGFDAGDGEIFYNMGASQTPDILNVKGQSYHYRIDRANIEFVHHEGELLLINE